MHPDHRRQEHGRHLLTSLGSKLAILGPPRIVAEVPEAFDAACGLFSASGYAQEAQLTDYVLPCEERDTDERRTSNAERRIPNENALVVNGRDAGEIAAVVQSAEADRFVIPVTVDDLAANGLLGEGDPQTCWKRSVETLTARKDDIAGLAVASDERIDAYVLYGRCGVDPDGGEETSPPSSVAGDVDVVSLRSFVEDGGACLRQLLTGLRARSVRDIPVLEGPPGGVPVRIPGDARVPPRRPASPLRSNGTVQLVTSQHAASVEATST